MKDNSCNLLTHGYHTGLPLRPQDVAVLPEPVRCDIVAVVIIWLVGGSVQGFFALIFIPNCMQCPNNGVPIPLELQRSSDRKSLGVDQTTTLMMFLLALLGSPLGSRALGMSCSKKPAVILFL